MALQFSPLAGIALRYGAVALGTYVATRRLAKGRLAQPVEDEMDDTPEGLSLRRDRGQVNGSARWVRVIRAGRRGPGLRLDATILGRLKINRA